MRESSNKSVLHERNEPHFLNEFSGGNFHYRPLNAACRVPGTGTGIHSNSIRQPGIIAATNVTNERTNERTNNEHLKNNIILNNPFNGCRIFAFSPYRLHYTGPPDAPPLACMQCSPAAVADCRATLVPTWYRCNRRVSMTGTIN